MVPFLAFLTSCTANEGAVVSDSPSLSLPVPDTTLAIYAVPVETRPTNLTEAVVQALKKRMKDPIRGVALNYVGKPFMRLEVWDRSKFPANMSQVVSHTTSSKKSLQIFEKCKNFVVVSCVGKPGWPPHHELAARAFAASFALEHNSCVADLYVPSLLSGDEALSSLAPDAAKLKFSDWLQVLNSSDRDGLWMTTRGLARAGLPEVQTMGVPPILDNAWTRVMSALSWKVVKLACSGMQNETTGIRSQIPSRVEITETDLAEVYGKKLEKNEPAKIELFLSIGKGKDGEEYLTVSLPKGEKRPFGEYLVSQAKQIVGSSHQRVVADDSDAIRKAMDDARASLPAIRKRFIAGNLSVGSRLIVKFRITDGTNNEYLWASVASWKSPDELQCYCGNDSQLDPKVRAGQPITLKADNLFDWAVMVNDDIVEGGLTSKVLGD